MMRLARIFILSAVAALAAAGQGAFALPPAQGQPGAPRTIVLPRQIQAGARATLAVLDSAGRLVPAVDVQLAGNANITTDSTGRASFTAPASPGLLTARLTENGLAFTTAIVPAAADPVVAPASNSAVKSGAGSPDFPRTIALHDAFELSGGKFSGDAAQNRVLLGDQLALVLAASPVWVVVLPNPHTPLGAAELLIEVEGRAFDPMPATVVSLDLAGPAKTLASGEKGTLTVRVTGSTERLLVEIRNLSPEIVDLNAAKTREPVQRMVTSGGDPNTARFELTGANAGDYSISAALVPMIVDSPNVERARQQLLAAQQVADSKWRSRIDTVVALVDEKRSDIAALRQEIERLINRHPQRQVADLLQLAWEALRYT